MGESPRVYISAIAQLFVHVLARVRRTRPSCILALRVALSYAVSLLDFRLTLVPMAASDLAPLQAQLQQVARSSLHLPTWFPSSIVWRRTQGCMDVVVDWQWTVGSKAT